MWNRITPNALAKSLEGSILARLLAVPGLQLVGARMIMPSDQMVDEYLQALKKNATEEDYRQAMAGFIDTELRNKHSVQRGYPNRIMLMLFKGEDAQKKITSVVGGHVPIRRALGHTIRGAFGDYNINKNTREIEVPNLVRRALGEGGFFALSDEEPWLYLKYRHDFQHHCVNVAPPPMDVWREGILDVALEQARLWFIRRDL